MRLLRNNSINICCVIIVCLLVSEAQGQYCSASGGCDEYIYEVQVGTINNTATVCNNYADYTSSHSTLMEIGTGYPITVVTAVGDVPYSGYEGDQCGIWVDWNQDGDFYDLNETVYTASGYGLFTTTIAPPVGAVAGDTRMRVRLMYTGALNPCGTTTYGEVEDYTITIAPDDGDCDTITIGTDSSIWAYPMYTYYHDSRTQVIYLASEIGSEGAITALGLDVATMPGQQMNDWTIRMQHTTMSSYSTASFESTDWTVVYQGNESIGSTGWRTFNFSTPFEYNGSDNLLVDFSYNNSSYSTYGMCKSSAPGGTRSAYACSDSGDGDPLDWSGTTSPTVSGTTSIPNVKLTICGNPPPSTVSISGYVKTADGVRIKGAIVSASTGPNTVTDALGQYTLTLPSPFSGTITPAQTDWTFDSRLYWEQTSDLVAEDFTGTYTVNYGGGSGTSFSPYLIYNAAQLNAIGAKAGDWGSNFRLMDDIDLSGYDGKEGRPSFNRIGYHIHLVDYVAFTGVFDGAGHTISNFTFDSNAGNDAVGIFGYLGDSGAQIKNVKLTNVDINSTSNMGAGGIVGQIYRGTVTGCTVQDGTVSGMYHVGGLVGWNVEGVVSDCNASSVVSGERMCGILIGENIGSVTNCSSKGSVNVWDIIGGGLVGSNFGTVESCYSTANIHGTGIDEIGGLVGRNLGIISNSYAMGDVSGAYPTGGLVGLNWDGTITNCYSTGASNQAGLIGRNIDGVITGSFWDKQTSGRTWSDGGTGKTTAEMQTEATFLGWDFEIETVNGDESIWYIRPNNYPRLCWEVGIKYGGGTGAPDDPYLIYTAEQMNKIGTQTEDWGKNFKLMADISLSAYSGSEYNIIGRSSSPFQGDGPFRGVFDGNYHGISGFSFSRSNISYVGIFGYVSDGTIKNLQLVAPSLTDAYYNDMKYVGPIAGCADFADISGCSVIGGTVEGEAYVGGLVGLPKASFIADCSSSASVSGTSSVGGLIGAGSTFGGISNIKDCYARGNVTGDDCVGGFIGNSSDVVIVNCYSTGPVSGTTNDANVGGFSGYNVNQFPVGDNVIGCFWDVESSSEPNSVVGTPLTTAQMYDQSTFTIAGWDFVEETDNGGSDDWAMPAGGGYPILWYELPIAPALPTFSGGSGTAGDPYLIGTEAQLNSIGHNPRLMDKHFRVISDLDLSGTTFYMIADRPYAFTGTFDGDNHTISNIEISSEVFSSRLGFIGYLYGTEAQIKNLTLYEPNLVAPLSWHIGSLTGMNENGTITNCHSVNANVAGWMVVGGLVGINYWYSTISGCSVTGDVSENDFMSPIFSGVGGLVGENTFWSEIENSFAKCNVSGQECLGGLVGTNLIACILTNCYSQGSVTGTGDYIGGLIGRNRGGTQTNYCYSSSVVTGPAGTNGVGGFVGRMGTSDKEYYTACFWDSEINPGLPGIGNGIDPNVIGESTANMQMASTFTSAGWDFVDDWKICDGTNYPKFAWQIPLLGDFVCPDGVDFIDFAVLGSAWLSDPNDGNWNPACDIFDPNDNIIDELDLAAFTENWLAGM